ncbi:hypothetical protein NMG60_11006854 [Bertholletia excelsa]
MDWELKASAWDLTELATGDGSSSLGGANKGGGFLVDLKLGGLGDIGNRSVDKLKLKQSKGTKTLSSPSGSTKRSHNVSCSVDGCTADLSKCREYHRRHRVCERHSKTPVVTIRGKELRFCQQCSRFQSLAEFDEEKRSCRRRLEGHNRRRRKPQPQPVRVGNQGAGLVQFSSPQSNTISTAETFAAWTGFTRQQQDLQVTGEHGRIRDIVLGDKQFPFLLDNDLDAPEETSSDGAIQQLSLNSRRAFSLLSTHPLIQTPATTWSNLVQRTVINHNLTVDPGRHFDGLVQCSSTQGMEVKPGVMIPQVNNTSNLCAELFQMPPDDLLGKGTF